MPETQSHKTSRGLEKKRIDANRQIQYLAKKAGLRWTASASQSRPDWTGGLIALRLARPRSS